MDVSKTPVMATGKEIKTIDMGEYNHKLMLKLISEHATPANQKLAHEWDNALFAGGAKKSTRATKLMAAYHLSKWAKKQDLAGLTKQDLIAFKRHLTETTFERNDGKPRKYKKSTIDQILITLKMLYKHLGKPEVLEWHKVKRQTHGRLKAEEILSQEEVLRMVSTANNKRDKAIIIALWESGCRAAEFLTLKVGDLHFEGETLSFSVDGKTGQRQCYLVVAVPSIVEYLEEHSEKNNPKAWLWEKGTHKNGARLTNSTLRRMLIKTAEKAGITKPVFSHAMRHSRATHAARQHLNEMTMRQIFGWSRNSTMPGVYISLSGVDTKNAALQLAGKQKQKNEEPIQPKTCVRCGTVAAIDGRICKNCFMPLTAEAAREKERQEVDKVKAMVLAALKEKGL